MVLFTLLVPECAFTCCRPSSRQRPLATGRSADAAACALQAVQVPWGSDCNEGRGILCRRLAALCLCGLCCRYHSWEERVSRKGCPLYDS